ncbi:hypothetical protein AB9R03_03645 [Neisseria gonorrhoeae]
MPSERACGAFAAGTGAEFAGKVAKAFFLPLKSTPYTFRTGARKWKYGIC